MLVEFRVKNFKSIRDDQVLSMVASKDTSLEDSHVLKLDGSSLKLLKSAAIYGPTPEANQTCLKRLVSCGVGSPAGELPTVLFQMTTMRSLHFLSWT